MSNAASRPRGNRRYVFADHGHSEAGQRQGMHLIRNNVVDVWQPCYGDGVTTVRIYPAKNVDDPSGQSWDPYRFSANPGDFGDWIRRFRAVRNFGEPGVTFIMQDPSDPTVVDPQGLPAWVLYNAIDRAVANKQESQGWAAMLRGGAGRTPQLPKPSEIFLCQGCILQHKQQVYSPPRGFSPDERPIVIALSQSAATSMIAEMDKVREGYQGAPDDWENMFVNGDPISLDTGRFVTFYKLADGDPRMRQQQATAGWNAPRQMPGPGAGGGRGGDPIGYGAYLEPTFHNQFGAGLRQFETLISSKIRRWDEILWFPTVEEQAMLLADKFPPDVILYAWRDHPEWIPEAVKARAVARTVVMAPNVPYQQGFGMPPAGPAMGFGAPPQPAGYQDPSMMQPQPGFGAPPQPGFGAPPQPGFGAPPQHGFGAPPQPGYVTPPTQQQMGFAAPVEQPQQPIQPPTSFGTMPQVNPGHGVATPSGFGAPPASPVPPGTPPVQPLAAPQPAPVPQPMPPAAPVVSQPMAAPGPLHSGPPGFGTPAYGQPAPAYGQPAPAYGQPAPAYGQPAPAYGQPATNFQPPPSAMGWMGQGNTAVQPQQPQSPVDPAVQAGGGIPAFTNPVLQPIPTPQPAAVPQPMMQQPMAAPQPVMQAPPGQPADGYAPPPANMQPQASSRAAMALAAAQRAAGS